MKRLILIALALAPASFTGCTTQKIVDYQPPASSISERTIQQSGLEIALDPFVERQRTKEYFDIDAVGEGIAILHVRIVNKTADKTFLVEKKNFQLVPEGAASGWTGDGKKIERSQSEGTSTELVGAFTGGLGGSGLYLAGLASVSKSTEIQRNFTGKEMADVTLAPGRSVEGFVYFTPVTRVENWSRAAAVKINLTETKTQQVVTFNIPLSH